MQDEEETIAEVGHRFDIRQRIGEGTYGKVYLAVDRDTRTAYALKKIPVQTEDGEGVPATAIREVSLLKQCDHENVIKLWEVLSGERALYLVFEHMDMDLRVYLKRRRGPSEPSP
ncbi:unnamed protein product [Effrenium voratum]|nr:unnamed protein product [Effrenium voratum]